MKRSRLVWFALTFLMGCVLRLVLGHKGEVLLIALTLTGANMLFFSVAGFLGFPMKGNADPGDVASGGIGLMAAAGVFYLIH